MSDDQAYVEAIVKPIVSRPEDVRTDRTIDERGVLLTLYVHPEDMGTIIGRQGTTARAIRTLLKIIGNKINARVNLKIHEPEGSKGASRSYADEDIDTSAVDNIEL